MEPPPRPISAGDLDAVVGRMTRWVWPFLGELDQGEDYDG